MDNVGIFYHHSECFTAVWCNLWQFGIVWGYLVYIFFPFWYVWTKKSGNPATGSHCSSHF
jgi:hypothetical protein